MRESSEEISMFGSFFIVVLSVTDIAVAFLDPRIRLSG
jgi:ABC-type dipeptide/oligopeptide/nickel transport system permease component